ncbi:putative F-box protein SKP2A [Apostichopus japonicus]|uniref:2'-phosphotransferase n=1 Tax=Stichopus japonicus TaxID=307972 RepID=A0A2G8K8V2_STIJA|nr:putative F-box protein SKP2A [Apostichopus japonicus]
MEGATSSLLNANDFSHNEKLSKRLAYILRYGAKKEGLTVSEKGFVDIDELMTLDLMKDYSADEIKREISISISASGKKRFQMKTDGKDVSVRASYRRRFEPKLGHLETLDISGCSHLTSVSFSSIPRALPSLRRLLMSNLPNLSETDILVVMNESQNLKYLQLYGNDEQLMTGAITGILGLGKEKQIYVAATSSVIC